MDRTYREVVFPLRSEWEIRVLAEVSGFGLLLSALGFGSEVVTFRVLCDCMLDAVGPKTLERRLSSEGPCVKEVKCLAPIPTPIYS